MHVTKLPKLQFHFHCNSSRGTSCRKMINFHGRICAATDSCQCKLGHLCITALTFPRAAKNPPQKRDCKFHSCWKDWSISPLLCMRSQGIQWDIEGFKEALNFQTALTEQQLSSAKRNLGTKTKKIKKIKPT